MTIAVCGNHQVNFCTESELAWTFEAMGHQVLRFQENKTPTDEMLRQCVANRVRLFVYVHTHGWVTPGQLTFDHLIEALRSQGIKTVSFHLDLYWGLSHDNREARIGSHPFWHTDRVFTADGGHQSQFAARKVPHEWLPPAVAARHCFRGTFRPEFQCDVAFVGSKNYHSEYPFRMQLITWLVATYGHRFRRFGGDVGGVIREAQLNDLYASVKVVVGDSCFGGAPFYWSDRIPETLGRGGFLVHPQSEGLHIPGLVTFQPKNISELKDKIDYYLIHAEERQQCTEQAMACVKAEHTYHQRMAHILNVMGLT